ncbi:hypothetical protein SAMN04487930_11175 [Cytophaga hutchinsonii ATCC 33406]|nr:hypothetical protein SAMN04487930_11175 [Cytophaga hutchinsonii ATCC 33406]
MNNALSVYFPITGIPIAVGDYSHRGLWHTDHNLLYLLSTFLINYCYKTHKVFL